VPEHGGAEDLVVLNDQQTHRRPPIALPQLSLIVVSRLQIASLCPRSSPVSRGGITPQNERVDARAL